MDALWPDTFVEEGNLTQNIFVLRKALGQTPEGRPYVETVSRLGYRLSVAVTDDGTPTTEAEAAHAAGPMVPGMDDAPRAAEEELTDATAGLRRPPGLLRTVAAVAGLCAAMLPVGWMVIRHGRRPVRPMIADVFRLTNDGISKNLGPFPSPLVCDGRSLYFTEKANNHSLLARVPLAGGPVSTEPAPFPDATLTDSSPLRHRLLIGSVWHTDDHEPILMAESPPGAGPLQPVPIGELKGHDASWSPGADRIAFARGRFLAVADASGANVRTLTVTNGVVYWPRWSPDGQLIRFSVNYGSNATEIWEVRPDGTGLRQPFAARADHEQICCGSWSGDGSVFAFVSTGPGTAAIWAAPARAEAVASRLAPGEADMWRSPLLSQDGRTLYLIGSHQHGELLRLDPESRKFVPLLNGLSAEGVSYSPDRQWIAYTAYPEGTLWVAHADGTGRRQLTAPPAVARFPRWSPDGRTLAFLSGQAGSHWRLYLASVATGAIAPLLEDGSDQGVASWSPDGSRIAFGRLPDYGTERNPNLSVQIYDRARGTRTTLHASEGLWTPRWSPDGRFFVAVTEDNRVLRLFDCQSGQWSDLADVGVNDVVWSPDSRYVFFDTVFGAEPSLYRVRLRDRHLERWADLRGLRRGGYFSPWLGIDPTGAPLLLRDATVEEVYRMSLQWQH